eukprot:12431311-Karenia_brevis.AAC.1
MVEKVVNELETGANGMAPCLHEAARGRQELVDTGADEVPTWRQAAHGATAPQPAHDSDTAFYERGWQGYASS